MVSVLQAKSCCSYELTYSTNNNCIVLQIETSIKESSPLLKDFTFTDVELGSRAPHVAGLKTYDATETRRDEIVMDLQLS